MTIVSTRLPPPPKKHTPPHKHHTKRWNTKEEKKATITRPSLAADKLENTENLTFLRLWTTNTLKTFI